MGMRGTYLEERLPRLDSSKMHSLLLAWQRLHGGPFSAPTHFILRRRQTVQALGRRQYGGDKYGSDRDSP